MIRRNKDRNTTNQRAEQYWQTRTKPTRSITAPRIQIKRSSAYDTDDASPFTAPPSKRIRQAPAEEYEYDEGIPEGADTGAAEPVAREDDVPMNNA